LNTPLFSVIIPTYNRADKLRRALESLAAQNFRDFEVVVCDDGSTDGTAEMVEAFAAPLNVRYSWDENFGGPARPRNRGISEAKGDWVCFLDADDWWYPDKLATVKASIGEADLIYHDFDVQTAQGKRTIGKHSRKLTSPIFADLMTKGCSIVTSSICVKKTILEESGGFTEERGMIAIEDYELWIRISRVTEKFLYIPQPLGAYWVDQANISGFSEQYITRETAVTRRYSGYLTHADRDEAERLLAYKTGVARKYLGDFAESRRFFLQAMRSRHLKIRLYAGLYFLLALMKSRCTIP
jgi:glycosyltransferase involved in cell wall biosynthesis